VWERKWRNARLGERERERRCVSVRLREGRGGAV